MLTRKSQDRKKMRKIIRIRMILVSALLSGTMVLVASTAIANESQDVIEKNISNSSEQQLNLNIQGEDPLPFSNEIVLPGRTSIFIAEYGELTGEYITHKKSTHTNLTLFEPTTGFFNDTSHNSSPKLKKQNLSHVSSSLLFPNLLQEAYTKTFPARIHSLDYKEYSDRLIPSSDLNSIRHLSNAAPDGFVKFESTPSEEEKPLGIKPLFKWLGWVCRTIFVDINEDGDIDAYGVTFVTTN